MNKRRGNWKGGLIEDLTVQWEFFFFKALVELKRKKLYCANVPELQKRAEEWQ